LELGPELDQTEVDLVSLVAADSAAGDRAKDLLALTGAYVDCLSSPEVEGLAVAENECPVSFFRVALGNPEAAEAGPYLGDDHAKYLVAQPLFC
jgi:hypothetical protein